jgi:hypothetical protein
METQLKAGFHVAHQNDDDLLIRHYEDVEPTLDYCARQRSIPQRPTKSGMRRVASIPSTIYYKWLREGIVDDPIRFRRAIEAYKKLKLVDDRLWIPTRAQKQIYSETGIVK